MIFWRKSKLRTNCQLRPKISVIVPVYLGAEWIESCLGSLLGQTYPVDSFEIIVVLNGPDDGTSDYLSKVRNNGSAPNLRVFRSSIANASAARNLGAVRAQYEFITWVDVDDQVSPEYLELLSLSINQGVLPVAQIVDVTPSGATVHDSSINKKILGQEKPRISPKEFFTPLTYLTGKVVPREWVIQTPFHTQLRSGEDLVFFGELIAKYDFEFDLMPAAAGAIYFRHLTETSVSRGNISRDFMVEQRLDVIGLLEDAKSFANKTSSSILNRIIQIHANTFIKRYLRENPDERKAVVDSILKRDIPNFPWGMISEPTETLVVAYNFMPYADTGAVVMAKRIREMSQRVDVISHTMKPYRTTEQGIARILSPYVDRHVEISGQPGFSSEKAVTEFVQKGLQIFGKAPFSKRNYKYLYSRSMWPASHLLAAAIKLRNPQMHWIAEFSDPITIDVEGKARVSPIQDWEFISDFLHRLDVEDRPALATNLNIFAWSELLPYLLADELVFTNENQLETMIKHAPTDLAKVIRRKSTIQPHPTLSPTYYSLGHSPFRPNPSEINIGYFGEFYSTRGLGEIFEAMSRLSVEKLQRIKLSIFSSAEDLNSLQVGENVKSRVQLFSKLSYLDFLKTASDFDCLIVNDAVTRTHHDINPYLPSKLSDYRGSGSKIWSLTEPGSILSKQIVDYTSELGNIDAAVQVLEALTVQLPVTSRSL